MLNVYMHTRAYFSNYLSLRTADRILYPPLVVNRTSASRKPPISHRPGDVVVEVGGHTNIIHSRRARAVGGHSITERHTNRAQCA